MSNQTESPEHPAIAKLKAAIAEARKVADTLRDGGNATAALEIYSELESTLSLETAIAKQHQGICYRMQGDLLAADIVLSSAICRFRELGEVAHVANSMRSTATLQLLANEGDPLQTLETAIKLHHETNDVVGCALTLASIAEVARRAGCFASARTRMNEALGTLPGEGHEFARLSINLLNAELLLAEGKPQEAYNLLKESLQLFPQGCERHQLNWRGVGHRVLLVRAELALGTNTVTNIMMHQAHELLYGPSFDEATRVQLMKEIGWDALVEQTGFVPRDDSPDAPSVTS